jgi:large subunit ribosomal protein L25
VDDTTKLRKKVPLHFSGEENSEAVKTDKCLVDHVTTEVEIECLAVQLPEFIAVDLSGLVKGKSLHRPSWCCRPVPSWSSTAPRTRSS